MTSSDVEEAQLLLRPLVTGDLADLLREQTLLNGLVGALGSPLAMVLPDVAAKNVETFRAVYRRHGLGGEIYFAHKANRSSALVRRMAATEAGLDVASLGELQHVLGAGLTPDRIMATGPKGPDLLWLAARTGIVVNLDSEAELNDLVRMVRTHRLPSVSVLLRLSGFTAHGTTMLTRTSRFGCEVGRLGVLLDVLLASTDAVQLIGVSYHLDTVGLPEKATALEGCLRALQECHRRGLTPRVVDIGGGFGVDYLAHAEEWEAWTTALSGAVLGHGPEITWQGHGYGLRGEAGVVRGAMGLYPAHRPVSGAAYLDALLTMTSPTLGRPLGTLLQEGMYDLWTEPGRALVDQCGVVLATVLEVRDTGSGDCLVRLAMNAGDASLEEHGVLMDPLLVPGPAGAAPEAVEGPTGVYLIGNLCLEADLITRRKVFLPARPRPGDLLAFPNTAGYFMDFSADAALHQPVARKVAVTRNEDTWRWCLDEQYWPIAGTGNEP